MKSFVLKLHKRDSYIEGENILYNIPIIDAFGIVAYTYYNGIISSGEENNIVIKDKKLILGGYAEIYDQMEELSILTVSYCAIRDYSLLFSNILRINTELATRLGMYYYEAEKAFENEAWLTYSLMCGAIYEGLLYFNDIKEKTFYENIEKAYEINIIEEKEKEIMHSAREHRNLVHANKYNTEYVSRKSAVDMRTTMDNLIYRLG